MKLQFILTDYVEAALMKATYDKLEDGTYAGKIPTLDGVLAFSHSLRSCEQELQSVLEDWILVGLRLGHPIPSMECTKVKRACE